MAAAAASKLLQSRPNRASWGGGGEAALLVAALSDGLHAFKAILASIEGDRAHQCAAGEKQCGETDVTGSEDCVSARAQKSCEEDILEDVEEGGVAGGELVHRGDSLGKRKRELQSSSGLQPACTESSLGGHVSRMWLGVLDLILGGGPCMARNHVMLRRDAIVALEGILLLCESSKN